MHACQGEIILLFEIGVRHDCTAFPFPVEETENLMSSQIRVCAAGANTIIDHYGQRTKENKKTYRQDETNVS